MGPVLPRVPPHLAPAAAAHLAGAAVRVPQAAGLQQPGAGGTWHLPARPGGGPHRTHTEQLAGAHLQTHNDLCFYLEQKVLHITIL